MLKTTAALMVAVLALLGCGEPPDTHPGQPVTHRRAAFREVLKAFEPMGVMLRTDRYDAKKFQAWSEQLMARRDSPWAYFGPDTQYPPSHATADVWGDAAKFATEKRGFFAATDNLAAIAGTPDKEQAVVAYRAVENTCRSCHKIFKTR